MGLRAAAIGALLALGTTRVAHAQDAVRWHADVAGGADAWLHPDAGAQGFAIFDLRGVNAVGRGDLHAVFNTDTLELRAERLPLDRARRFEFMAMVRGEALIAGVLTNYFVNAVRDGSRTFYASYVHGTMSLKWHAAPAHTFELVATARRWFFGRIPNTTSAALVLPPETWVFEPRLRYTLWNATSPGSEWQPHVLFPRVVGVVGSVELGLDARGDARAWGMLDGAPQDARNRPGAPILMARQYLRAGFALGRLWRFELDESASYGAGEDDLTRVRAGGMNPWVVAIPGLGWPALLSERLVAAQAGLFVRPGARSNSELGLLAAGGVFDDPNRTGALDTYGVAAGFALHADLRFGAWQFYLRAGWAVPTSLLANPPHVGVLAALGVPLF